MTHDAREAIARMAADPNGRTPLGYGPPSALTRELIASDTIEIVTVPAEPKNGATSSLWYAELTHSGRKIAGL